MSRAEFAVGTNNLLSILLDQVESRPADDPPDSRFNDKALMDNIAESFWHLEFLIRTFLPEMISFGVKEQDLWDSLARLKDYYASVGIVLRDPYNERFTDVPEGHWANEAVHNLRRNGIVYGYPDGTYGY